MLVSGTAGNSGGSGSDGGAYFSITPWTVGFAVACCSPWSIGSSSRGGGTGGYYRVVHDDLLP